MAEKVNPVEKLLFHDLTAEEVASEWSNLQLLFSDLFD